MNTTWTSSLPLQPYQSHTNQYGSNLPVWEHKGLTAQQYKQGPLEVIDNILK